MKIANMMKQKLSSWAWCLHKALTRKIIKNENVKDNTLVYRGVTRKCKITNR